MSARREPTKGTEIAAFEASRNELQVRADGALLGEKRAAVARLVMIGLFGMVAATRGGPRNWYQTVVGAGFSVYAVVTLIAIWRIKRAKPSRSLWAPVILTVLDFAGSTALGMLDVWWTGEFWSGRAVISSSILIVFSIARISVWHVALSVALAEISFVMVAVYAGTLGSNTTLFVTTGFFVLGLLIALTNRAVGTMFQQLRARDNLTRFLPRQVAERVMLAGPDALAPVEREITILFSDIRGFTGMSEGLPPRDVLMMLDDYFGRMGQIVKGHDGVVGKFMGDGLLAFWGVPDRLDDHASRAVKAARDMRTELREINRFRVKDGKPPIQIGIGIHTGTVAAGMLGGALQAEYTVIGDPVNVASRIESLTKDHSVDLLISETTWAQLGGALGTRRLSEAQIRGRKEPVVLYTIDDVAP